MKDYSIECAKDYKSNEANEVLIAELKSLKSKLASEGKTFSQVLLVDDTTFTDKSYDLNNAVSWLDSAGLQPEVVFRESQLKDACDEVLKIIDFDKLDPMLAEQLQGDKKYHNPSLYLAAWYLVRLGRLKHDQCSEDGCANNLINILPTSFEQDDGDALEIVKATPYSEAAPKVENRFV